MKLTMSSQEYHAHPAISNSLLVKVLRSPAHALSYLQGTQETTTAMEFGTALHCAVLEPDLYAQKYAAFDGDRRTKEGKATYEALLAYGKTIIKAEDAAAIEVMRMSILAHPSAGKLLRNGQAEQSIFWTDEDTGEECKCRPDYLLDEIVVDLKSTDDASPQGFARSLAQYKYHMQAAHYLEGTCRNRFIFIAVEKKPPYAVAVYEIDALSLDKGQADRRRALSYWKDCKKLGVYPAYHDEIMPIGLPVWAFKEEQE